MVDRAENTNYTNSLTNLWRPNHTLSSPTLTVDDTHVPLQQFPFVSLSLPTFSPLSSWCGSKCLVMTTAVRLDRSFRVSPQRGSFYYYVAGFPRMHLYIDLSTARVLLAYHVGWVACIAVHICRDMISNIISSFVSWPCLRWFSGHCVDVVSLRTSTRARPPVCTFMRAHVHMYIRVYCVC